MEYTPTHIYTQVGQSTGQAVSGQEQLLRDVLKKIEQQEERIKELENSVYMLERTVYDTQE
jgi:hypothetical protein